MARKTYWCVAEISEDGKMNPISPAFEYAEDAEDRKKELLAKEKYPGKNLEVIQAPKRIDPRRRKA